MIGAAKDKSSLPGSLTALRVLLCLLITFLLAGTRAEAFFAPPDQAPGQIAAFQPDSTGKTTTAWQYDALDSLIAAKSLPIPGACFVKGTQIETECGGREIESMRVGERVTTTDWDSSTEVDPATWRKITLRMPNPECPSDVLELELLRSVDWMEATGCQPGARMWFELDEMGLRGWADVQSVAECPVIQSGRGRVVLATVTHYNTFVMEVRLEGQAEPMRPTDRHRLFSLTRNDWTPTASLQVGEILRTADGTARVASVQPWPGTHRVFNIEVETEHSYFAGKAKVLSHNANPCAAPLPPGQAVIAETLAGRGNLTSAHTLHVDDALTAGQRFVGPGYTEIGKAGSGVFRSADGLRQFRMDNNSILGRHDPKVPHVHFEVYPTPVAPKPSVNNHVPFVE